MVEHVRIAIVDIGSNAIRFMIAETTGREHRVLESHRLAIRLGQYAFQSGVIPDAAMAAVTDAFRKFRQSCEHNGVESTRAIATAAMRAATNADELIERVRAASDFEIDIISGQQEAHLLKLGIETKLDLSKDTSLLIDVGGGSVEVVAIDGGEVAAASSHPLGGVRLLELLRDTEHSQFVSACRAHLREHLVPDFDPPVERYAAVGGNIECLADLISGTEGTESCQVSDLKQKVLELAALTPKQRIEQFGLRPDRADAIVPAGLVYLHLAKLANVKTVLVPRTGIKEGLIAETSGITSRWLATDAEIALASCRALGERHSYNSSHAESVCFLAGQLFDQTHQLHGLSDQARLLLQAASLLHDVGRSVHNDSHHKHSQYLIEANELAGLSEHERRLIATIARYHRKALPARDHTPFADLRRREQNAVRQLAALLRLADALDRQHAHVVSGVTATIRKQRFEMRATLAANNTQLALEGEAVASKGDLFEQVFGYKPSLVTP